MNDIVQRFLLEALDIRGSIVRLDSTWQAIQADHPYASRTRELLGEVCAVTAAIAANLKQPGRLTVQLRGHGAVSMLVVDCSQTLNLRGYVQADQGIVADASLSSLLGDGSLLLTLDAESMRQPYQSHVPLQGDSLREVFAHYLAQSEQQPTWLLLAANAESAAALFLQKLPDADLRDEDGWARVTSLAETVKAAELLDTPPETLLHRLFHEETVRVFSPRAVTHDFPPDWDKVRSVLRSLGSEEIERILAEHGEVVMRDDLSNHTYRFSADEARAVLAGADVTRH